MRVLSSGGYFGTGSSAVTDLMLEYDCVGQNNIGTFEVAFFHGYDGVDKLYNSLISRRKFQDIAIHEFMNGAHHAATFGTKMNYEKYFNNTFMKYTREYVDELQYKTNSYHMSQYDFRNLNDFQSFVFRGVNKLYSVLFNEPYNRKHSDVRVKKIPIFVHNESFNIYDLTEEEFITITKHYLEKLFSEISCGKEIVYIDGLFPGFYLDDISPFYDDLRVTIVDRDPRDVYLSNKYIWKGILPSDPHDFCRFYKSVHCGHRVEKSKVLYLQFEDMIFDYDNTIANIEDFFGISSDQHIRAKENFNPDVSSKNCRLWKQFNDKESIKIIEQELPEYIVTKYE